MPGCPIGSIRPRPVSTGFTDGLDPAWREVVALDLKGVESELSAHISKETADFDLSVAARMVFSCLVEADYRDTEAFYARLERRQVDRTWPALAERLPDMTASFDSYMAARPRESDLNALRGDILAHVRDRASLPPGLFTLRKLSGRDDPPRHHPRDERRQLSARPESHEKNPSQRLTPGNPVGPSGQRALAHASYSESARAKARAITQHPFQTPRW